MQHPAPEEFPGLGGSADWAGGDQPPSTVATSAAGECTYSVLELGHALASAVSTAFPTTVWVRGEVSGLGATRGRRHLFFQLVQKDPGAHTPIAALNVALLSWNRDAVAAGLASVPGFVIEDGMEVRVCGQVEFFGRTGRVQLVMTGIDPEFTLGRLAAAKDRTIASLKAAGLIDANAALALARVPLRVGLVTSVGSAAYNDFCAELRRSGFGFRVVAVDARVQGDTAEQAIVKALAVLRRRSLDAVAIVRGGGSRSDLACFDAEQVARAIAFMPVPVLTGIGHEVDSTVADLVAHASFKTPTACAAALTSRVGDSLGRAEVAWSQVTSAARDRLRHCETGVATAAAHTTRAARLALRAAEQAEAHASDRLGAAARQTISRCNARMDVLDAHLRALDPQRVLERGYSVTRREDGRVVRFAAEVAAGETLRTTVAEGELTSTVRSA
jgi:exodeoxyribonuclease VII large subunit